MSHEKVTFPKEGEKNKIFIECFQCAKMDRVHSH